jgi:L,D-transpeptidase ErfK/SrfK
LRRIGASLAALLAAAAAFATTEQLGVSRRVLGASLRVQAQAGDSLTSIGARYGVDVATLARANGLASDARLALGQSLRIDNPHIVPRLTDGGPLQGILVNVPQRMLFVFEAGAALAAYPVAAGRPSWPTPLGAFTVDERAVDKTWVVPASIQAEMAREGKPVLTRVAPGAENPLGRYWLGLSPGGCGIHATNAPASIYGLRTHGCIRLHEDDAGALYERTALRDTVRIVYQPVLLAELADGRVCLEAHRDAYRRAQAPEAELDRLLSESGTSDRIDRLRALAVLEAREGVARDVTRGGADGGCS